MGVMKKKKQQQHEKEDVTAKETQAWRRLRNLFSTSTSASASAKWKRVELLQTEIVDGVVFKVMYVVEALVLVSTLCFFYLCCGCHI